MISRRRLLGTATALGTAAATAAGAAPAAHAAAPATGAAVRRARVTRPTVEYVGRPLGLDVDRPRLSWPVESGAPGGAQRAYRVRVATGPARLSDPDVWDSGRVESADSVLVPYGGPELRPRTRYYWTVRVWDRDGTASDWSERTSPTAAPASCGWTTAAPSSPRTRARTASPTDPHPHDRRHPRGKASR